MVPELFFMIFFAENLHRMKNELNFALAKGKQFPGASQNIRCGSSAG